MSLYSIVQAQPVDEAAKMLGLDAVSSTPLLSQVFEQNCASCHGSDLQGGIGPSLLDATWVHGADDASILRTITKGVPEKGMPGFEGQLTEAERRGILAMIHERGTDYIKGTDAGSLPLPQDVQKSKHQSFKFEVIAKGLEVPWSTVFIGQDRMLVSERPGRLRVVHLDGRVEAPLKNVPLITSQFYQGGMLGLVLHPNFKRNGFIYLAFSDEAPEKYNHKNECAGRAICFDIASQTKVIRFRIKGDSIVDQKVIWTAPYATYRHSASFGGRLAFGADGMLYFSVGDRVYAPTEAQDIELPNGKIHRVMDDGRIPPDNPYVHVAGADASIWTVGHRAPQGLAVDRRTGDLWATEHGPRGGDELNLLQRGGNYGWPFATYGMGYDGRPFDPAYAIGRSQAVSALPPIKRAIDRASFVEPVMHWNPSIAISAISFYSGKSLPGWRGDMLVTSLKQQKMIRLKLNHRKVIDSEVLFEHYGRLRDVVEGPDGFIYLAMNSPDQIIRLVPAR